METKQSVLIKFKNGNALKGHVALDRARLHAHLCGGNDFLPVESHGSYVFVNKTEILTITLDSERTVLDGRPL
jgi:hypothetical protein